MWERRGRRVCGEERDLGVCLVDIMKDTYHFLYETLSMALLILDFKISQIRTYSSLYFLASAY